MGRVLAIAVVAGVFACAASGGAGRRSGCDLRVTIATSPADVRAGAALAAAGCAAGPVDRGVPASGPAAGPADAGTISTVAGGGIGDGGPARRAVFFLPAYDVFDGAGNLYVSTHGRVVKVTPDHVATTFAGTGTISFQPGHVYYGDGGPATDATFGNGGPSGLAFDAQGNLFVADTGNGVIRKVDTSGVITTVAGGGPLDRYGLEGDDPRDVYLWAPDGVAVDAAGNLFIADSGYCTIRELKASDGKIYTFAGVRPVNALSTLATCGYNGDGIPALASQLDQPKDVKVDAAGNVYLADIGNSRVREVDATGLIHTVAGDGSTTVSGDGGPATGAGVPYPWHIALDPSGALYIVEYFDHVVRRVGADGIITTLAGNGTEGFSGDGGPATDAQLYHPLGIAIDAAGNAFVADFGNNRVREVFAASGRIRTVAGNGDPPHEGNVYYGNGFAGDGLPAPSASLNSPRAIAIRPSGAIYIADAANNRVRKVSAATGTISTVAGNGESGQSGDGGLAKDAAVGAPSGLAFDRKGNLYIAAGVIRKVDPQGIITTVAVGEAGAVGLAFHAGSLYIADYVDNVIRRLDSNGVLTTVAGNGTKGFAGDGGPATDAELDNPQAVAFDTAGNYYIADAGNGRIRKVDRHGIISTLAGNGAPGYDGDGRAATDVALNFPLGVAADAAGDVFVSDSQNCLVREVDAATGLIHVVAGVPLGFDTTNPGFMNCDFNGDGGPATDAHLFVPSGLAIAGGNLFLADAVNNRIREIEAP